MQKSFLIRRLVRIHINSARANGLSAAALAWSSPQMLANLCRIPKRNLVAALQYGCSWNHK